MAYLTDEDLEAHATDLRRKMGLSPSSALTWTDVLPRIDKAFPGLRLVVVPDEEMRYAPAEANPAENKIKFRQTAFDQLKKGSPWALETLAHELSHFQLEHDGVRYRRGGINHSRKTGNDEPQAHLLAKAFLAPASRAVELTSATELAREFNMTAASAEKRKEVVDRMHRRKTKQERQLPQNTIDFLKAAKARGYKVTALD